MNVDPFPNNHPITNPITNPITKTEQPMHSSTFLVALVDSGGTVPPELGAVRRLVARGHRVVVLAEDSTADEVRATGATLRRWEHAPNRLDRTPEHDPSRDWECTTPFQLFDRLLDKQFVGPAAAYATDVTAAIADVRPDVVLCSQFAFGAMVAAEAAGVDFDVLMPNVYLLPVEGTTPVGMGLRPAVEPVAPPGLGEGTSPAERRARRVRSAAARTLLRPDRPRTAPGADDVGGVRLPGRATGERPVRRSGARRSVVGR
jgi:hypothetical protein